jgi:hypothetical protein
MLRAVKLECDSLVDRHRHGFRCGITLVPCVNRDRLSLHASINLSKCAGSVHFAVVATLATGADAGL